MGGDEIEVTPGLHRGEIRRDRRRLRVAGVGMPGYYTGLYWLEGGTVRLWATRAQDGILIDSGGRFLVTPEHAEEFLLAVQAVGAQVQA